MVWEFLNIAESSLIRTVSFIAILYLSLNNVCTMGCILHIERRYGKKHLPSLLLYFIMLPSSYLYCYVIIILLSSFSWRHLRWDRISTSRTSLLAFYYALFDIFFVLFLFSLAIYFIYRLHGFFFYRSIFSPFFFWIYVQRAFYILMGLNEITFLGVLVFVGPDVVFPTSFTL